MDTHPFMAHHREVHGQGTTVQCYYCSESIPLDAVEDHFKQRHHICRIHCRYCSFGTSDTEAIIFHLCSFHPNRTARVVLRDPVRAAFLQIQNRRRNLGLTFLWFLFLNVASGARGTGGYSARGTGGNSARGTGGNSACGSCFGETGRSSKRWAAVRYVFFD